MFLNLVRPWMLFETPDDRNGSSAEDDEPENLDEDIEEEGETGEEEEEFETDFEAELAKNHPELLDGYRQATSGLHSALVKERANARKGRDASKKLKTYEDREAEATRAQRTKEENLEADLNAATKRADEAEAELARVTKERAVLEKAATLNFKNPQDAIAFVDMGSFEADDAKGIEAALKDLAKSKPYLIRTNFEDDDKGNERGGNNRKLDDDPKKKKKIKEQQPKIAI